jgi:hypothetical protein
MQGCTAIFNASTIDIIKNNKTILQGYCNLTNGMWEIGLTANITGTPITSSITAPPLPQAIACNAIEHKTKANLLTFLYTACFSPAILTFLQAVKAGYFTTWLGLTPKLVSKHLPKSIASVKGHLNQQHKNVNPTKPKTPDTFFRTFF